MNSLILVGAGGHARSIIDIIESNNEWKIYGLVGFQREIGENILGYKVIGTDEDLPNIYSKCHNAVIALGKIGKCEKREIVELKLKKIGFNFPTIKSDIAYLSKQSSIGSGTTVGHGVIINAGSKIGSHCILNSNSLIEHDCIIGDHCHISTGVIINGGCEVGDSSFIGSGSIIREGVKIPPNTIISSGKRIMGWPIK
tara:strand:+ start:2226 stop:2819 length:594 start_codon:yes stop_codon:yes gene_type:complete